jgi:hypothetical protein
MISYRNIPQDFIMYYNPEVYRKIEKIMDIKDKDGATVHFHFLLALLGLKTNKKIPLDETNCEPDEKRSFSLRTLHQKEATIFETYFGLITILDNLDKDYNDVVNKIAFEKTEINQTPFLKMTNVKTFYNYMMSGLDVIKKDFFHYGDDPVDVADQIHQYLEEENEIVYDALDTVLEGLELEND